MVYLSLLLSMFSIMGLAFVYYQVRKKEEASIENLSNRISGLLSEFNSITSSKIDLLDDRINEVRNVMEVAEHKIEKIESLLSEIEDARRTFKRMTEQSSENEKNVVREEVLELADKGYTTTQIAEETGLKPGEVSVIVRLDQSKVLDS